MNYTGFDLSDKVAIVVGGTSGIGHATGEILVVDGGLPACGF